jgi:hypothetical protein
MLIPAAPKANSGQLIEATPQKARTLVLTVANETTVGMTAKEAPIKPTPAKAGSALVT